MADVVSGRPAADFTLFVTVWTLLVLIYYLLAWPFQVLAHPVAVLVVELMTMVWWLVAFLVGVIDMGGLLLVVGSLGSFQW